MTKAERIFAAVRGEEVDSLPYSFWTHFPGIDLDPQQLADRTVRFYKEYDLDFIKIMSNGMYAIEDFGCEIDFSTIEHGGAARLLRGPITMGDDWDRIEAKPTSAPALSRELSSLKKVVQALRGEHVPVVFTVFSPFTIADKLCGGKVVQYINNGCGDKVRNALEAITRTTCSLVKDAIDAGADGIYFATQMSDESKCTKELYREYAMPWDLMVFQASAGKCDMLHAHGDAIMFDILKNYPTNIFNWHIFESKPSLSRGAHESGLCVMGGLRRGDITGRNREAVEAQIRTCLETLGGRKHILTPGCVLRYPLDREMLLFVRQVKQRLEKEILG